MTLVTIAAVLLALLLGGAWYVYSKTVNALTAGQPEAVQMEAPSAQQYTAANQKLEQIRQATATQQAVTVEWTAADLNALIARHPSFSGARDKARVEIADSTATLTMSVPLTSIPLPIVKHRWFNGAARFGLVYDEDRFEFALKSLSANGHDIDLSPFQALADSFNDSFNEGFDRAQRDGAQSNEWWENVKSITISGDKLIMTTKAAAPEPAPSP